MTAMRTAAVRVLAALLLAAAAAWAAPALGKDVTPSAKVTTSVVIRAKPSTASAPLGRLLPGQTLPETASLPYWYEVTLADGTTGYVSKVWTREIEGQIAPAAPGEPRFRLYAIDVGTGLALFVTGPDFALLYDAGSNDDLARGASNRVVAFLHKVRPDLRRIDHVILSHPHRDHVELMPDVINAYEVGNVWDSGRVNPICGYRLLLLEIVAHPGIGYHNALDDNQQPDPFPAQTCYGKAYPAGPVSPVRGTKITSDPIRLGADATMTILHADGTRLPSPNQNSVVVRLDLGGKRMLLMGDAEAGGRADPSEAPKPGSIENDLLACCTAALKADLMVAGHHGSRTSSRATFVAAVGAHDFIISSGPTKYASVTLPDQVIVDELSALGTVWRTDINDAQCAQADKIGPDHDGKPGGCDNIEVDVDAAGNETVHYLRITD